MIIGILGVKRSGKDTTADYLVTKYGYNKLAFAQPLKDACKILFDFSEDQMNSDSKEDVDPTWGVSPRIVFQYLGTDIFRKEIHKIMPDIENNFWVKVMENKIMSLKENNKDAKIIVSDVRFQNEIDMIHRLNGIIIKIERPSLKNIDTHESEKNICNLNGDIIIVNDKTINDLYDETDNIVNNVFKKIYL